MLHVNAGLLNSSDALPSSTVSKITNAELIIRKEYQPEVLGSREMTESRRAEIRVSVTDQILRNLKPRNMRMLVDTGEVDVCCEIFLGSLVYSVLIYHR